MASLANAPQRPVKKPTRCPTTISSHSTPSISLLPRDFKVTLKSSSHNATSYVYNVVGPIRQAEVAFPVPCIGMHFAAGQPAYRATERTGSLARAGGPVGGNSLGGGKPA